ncbi:MULTISPECIES: redox-active disulfide protein 2 [unclassified Spirosoma]|uniref:redox-active disulfide protein 2 n=1 Tax=unclassified Spirosoma TaxID=2621999 RepID=UPI00095B8018|nr:MULTISPECIES: redox-active disulfide protein 2 [unclassified Spirosoma]MBN8823468.1 redox-active disulfide protein 2 [Spirosoma sp.]OJW71920.1 MAG: redox-active disulfide protein 2 [Spirosoma sp. 48-14]
MKGQKIEEMSNEALLKQKKTTELATGILAGMLLALLVMVVFLATKKGLNATSIGLGVIPFAFMPILFINWNNLKAIKKELSSRENLV